MAWPPIKKNFTQDGFQEYVDQLRWGSWRPSLIVWHNTWLPTLAMWQKTAAEDEAAGRTPGITRINNLETWFGDIKGWYAGPHLFITPKFIWVFNRLTAPGVHSPSWNSRSIGIEMVADFDKEDDDSGAGLLVKNHTIFATAILCEALGIDPETSIKLHREDPRTTHKNCPGINIARDKGPMMEAVAALMTGGDHEPETPQAEPVGRRGVVQADNLNVRTGPGVRNPAVTSLWKGAVVTVLGEARNGTTVWLRIRTPAGHEPFWVAGRYVKVE